MPGTNSSALHTKVGHSSQSSVRLPSRAEPSPALLTPCLRTRVTQPSIPSLLLAPTTRRLCVRAAPCVASLGSTPTPQPRSPASRYLGFGQRESKLMNNSAGASLAPISSGPAVLKWIGMGAVTLRGVPAPR